MKKNVIVALFTLLAMPSFAQKVLHTNEKMLEIKVNGKISSKSWAINSKIKPDVFMAEVSNEKSEVIYSDGKNNLSFDLKKGETIDFLIIQNKKDTAYQRIIGIAPNVNFTKDYINKYKGKTEVAIPEVSELVNILMALHPDAEKEINMFDTKTEYYKQVKEYFKPYLNHPAIDTIKKYITDLQYIEDYKGNMFSNTSYRYYYALKMNACAYNFDKNGEIKNNGNIGQMAKGWYTFDPMKDAKVFQDFAKVSNFRVFYKNNQPYYTELLQRYNQLNPIQKMQNWLDKKFGFGYGSYAVYFSPLIYGAHSTSRFEDNGFTQTIMFIARADFDSKLTPTQNELLESRVVFTEIDHNYVNPVSDKYVKQINEALSNRKKWAKPTITDMYESPYKVFNEYMTFAVYILYVHDNYSKTYLDKYLPELNGMMSNMRGFAKFTDFNQVMLAKYKENPSINMTDLYEYMLDWCKKENEID
ncbi:DUF4932 domain-containing protein [Empedobacter falsenii]|uniref:DUF4932 domain-containing protein n=1 Tax=Empedobacter falsenii TaxID=343874 RepID=UPI003A7F6DA1